MIGKTVSHYRIISKLGEGGMGVVYRAEDTKLRRIVALKFLPPELTSSAEARERFIHEAQAASSLDHPNICTVHEIDAAEGGRMFIAMACYEGEPLKSRIQRGPLGIAQAVTIAAQIAQGLAKAHAKGIVHRDIKPGNVILTDDGIAKILDFGLAKLSGRTLLTKTGSTLGTVAYMSPEQARGDPVDHRTDIWSLGIILYEMLTGRRPFRSEYEQALVYSILNEDAEPLSTLRPDIPWALQQVVARAMARNLDERYQNAEELLGDLRRVSSELKPASAGGEAPSPTPTVAQEAQSPGAVRFAIPDVLESQPERERPVFVARDSELEALAKILDAAVGGRGAVAFVTGEVGSGKTALLAEFARRAQDNHADLVFAQGNCNAHTGIGDPYLPFREILGLLTGDVEAKWIAGSITREHGTRLLNLMFHSVQALADAFPDLINTFVPGAELVSRVAALSDGRAAFLPRLRKFVERKASMPADATLQQSSLFEQYTRLLQTLARRTPLLLVLEDLQWADIGSSSLLFHLGRRLEGSRILLLCSFRPAEVVQSAEGERGQLSSVINELRRTFGDSDVSLGLVEDRHFVDAYLDEQPNCLGPAFRETLFRHTKGQPLFTVELLRSMQESAMLLKNAQGQWTEAPGLEWGALPIRVEAAIAERVGRLSESLRQVLILASVEGEEFTAEVTASLHKTDVGELVRVLSGDLDRHHHLVKARGIRRVGDRRFSLYQFQHILFQRYLYGSLDEVERSHLHERVGTCLESLYGRQSEEIAVQLARHFEKAGMTPKAIDYLLIAGKHAIRVSANDEAIAHFTRALELVGTLPESPECTQLELSLQLSLVLPWQASKGFAAPELGKATQKARELCRKLGTTPQSAVALAQLAAYYATLPKYRAALELTDQLRAIAERADDPTLMAVLHYTQVWPLLNVGELAKGLASAERMLEFYDPQKHAHWAYLYGYDYGVMALAFGSWVHWFLGHPDRALKWGNDSLDLARKLGHPFTLAFALTIECELRWFLRDFETISKYTDELIPLSTEKGFLYWQGHGIFYQGERWFLGGRFEQGVAEMRRGIATMRATGTETCLTRLLARMADACLSKGLAEEGLAATSEAMEFMERFDERYMEAELQRLKGELLLLGAEQKRARTAAQAGGMTETEAAAQTQTMGEAQVTPRAPLAPAGAARQAEECFVNALEVSRKQSARSWELRAVMSLSRLWWRQDKRGEARELLEKTYGWFTEGHETADLREARLLLKGMDS